MGKKFVVKVKAPLHILMKYYRPVTYTRYSIRHGTVIVKTMRRRPLWKSERLRRYREYLRRILQSKKFVSFLGPQLAFMKASRLASELAKLPPEQAERILERILVSGAPPEASLRPLGIQLLKSHLARAERRSRLLTEQEARLLASL